jgi:peroxisomal 2,4-dienoyl-CoA reductase
MLCSASGTPYQVHVSAAKAAVDATSAVLAVEEGPRGVRSNVIAPGPIAGTEGMNRLSNKASGSDQQGWLTALGRMGDVRDVANAAVFLFSDAASFVTGQVIAVDGASESIRGLTLPYPMSVLEPEKVRHLIAPKM